MVDINKQQLIELLEGLHDGSQVLGRNHKEEIVNIATVVFEEQQHVNGEIDRYIYLDFTNP